MFTTWVVVKYFVILLPYFYFWLESKLQTKASVLEWFGLLVLIAFSVLRYGVGRDYYSYMQIYNVEIPNGNLYFAREPIFLLLNKSFDFLGLPYNLFLGAISSFYIIVFYKCILKKIPLESRHWFFLIFLLLSSTFFTSLNLVRQSIAASFLMLAVNSIEDKKFKSWIWFALGCLSHFSLVIFTPLMITRMRVSRRILIILVLFFVIMLIAPGFILMSFQSIQTLIGSNISEFYFQSNARNFSFSSALKVMFSLLSLIPIYFVLKLRVVINDRYVDLALLSLYFSVLIAVGINSPSRLIFYCQPFYVLVLYYAYSFLKIKLSYILIFVFVIFSLLEAKMILSPLEYSRYSAQFRLLPFFDETEIQNDYELYYIEEILIKNSRD